MHKASAISQLLATIPGVGPIIALTLAIEIDPAAFESGRHLAAWVGSDAEGTFHCRQAAHGRDQSRRSTSGCANCW